MSELFGDRPIFHPKDDAFGLSSFADALATSLLKMSPHDGLVISVEGPWGAGKSSAIALAVRTIMLRVLAGLGEGLDDLEKLTECQLETRWAEKAKIRKAHIVRFNPWNFSGQENLVRAFFGELAAQIDVEPEGALKKAMNRLAGYLPSVTGGLVAGGMMATGHLPAAAAAGAAGRAAGEAAERALKSEISLEGAKKKLGEALRDADDRIIVIVDDLDRLMPNEMRSVFSLVKSLGDLPNVLYVLSYDEGVVRNVLKNNPDSIDPAFLEKIVQVSLKLPPPWRDELRQLLFVRLKAIVGEAEPADQERWRHMLIYVVYRYLETPRDVTRLVNTLKVIWPNVSGDVDITDLIGITTLQLFDENIYALIRDEIEVITHADHRYEEDKKFGERMMPDSARKPDVAKNAMAIMFPRLAKLWQSFMGEGANYITQKEQRRICTKEYHRNYFIFGRDSSRFSRTEINDIVTIADPAPALSAILKRLSEDREGRSPSVPSLLEQITEALSARPLLNRALLCAILDHSDDLIRREDVVWELFVTDNGERLRTLINFGIKTLTAPAREEILHVLVWHSAGLQTRADIVLGAARRHGLYGGDAKHETEQLFAAEQIEAAALAVRDQIITACTDGTIWDTPHPTRLIWAWKHMEGGDALADWLSHVLADDELIVRLANELPGNSYQSGGREGARVVSTFNRNNWQHLLDVDSLLGRLEALASSNADAAAALSRLRDGEKAAND